jgi:hypothetical protein
MVLITNNKKVTLAEGLINVAEKLPTAVYTIHFDSSMNEFFLTTEPSFSLPKKLYGDFSCIQRWIQRWEAFDTNLGIFLHGLKGSGKTVTAKLFCCEMLKRGSPIIMLQSNFVGGASPAELVRFLAQPELAGSVIFIDEFEKVIDQGNTRYRNSPDFGEIGPWLPLFDGMFNTKLVFLLTSNTVDINNLFINRPGRIRYSVGYTALPNSVVTEVIADFLKNPEYEAVVKKALAKFGDISFDSLVAALEEIIMVGDIENALTNMNIKPEVRYYTGVEVFGANKYIKPLFPNENAKISVDLGALLDGDNIAKELFATHLENSNNRYFMRTAENNQLIADALGQDDWAAVLNEHGYLFMSNSLRDLSINEVLVSASGEISIIMQDNLWKIVLSPIDLL